MVRHLLAVILIKTFLHLSARAPKLKCDRVGLLEYFGDSLSVHFNGFQPVSRELFGVSCIFT